jgi:WD40 repeat protein
VLFDLHAGYRELILSPPIARVRALAFSPTGGVLAATSFEENKTVLCDPMRGKTLHVLSTSSVALSVAISPDGKTLATGGRDGKISLWDVASGETRQRLEGDVGPILSVTFSPVGTLLASASLASPFVKLWEPSTGRLIRIIKANRHSTNTVAFSPDGNTLASGGNDGMVRLWNVASGRQRLFLDARSSMLRKVAFSPDGRTLLATANDDQIRLWQVAGLSDDLPDAGGSDSEPDRCSSNNPRRSANSYSGSAPPPVYLLEGLRAQTTELDVCLDG